MLEQKSGTLSCRKYKNYFKKYKPGTRNMEMLKYYILERKLLEKKIKAVFSYYSAMVLEL